MELVETIVETQTDSIKIVTFNNPKKKNAMNSSMYLRLNNIFNEAANNNSITMLVLTGTGDFYSSGNDFSIPTDNSFIHILSNYIKAFITFPKLLVAIVNGPAIGIAATTLALCDLVFASENSYFYTPFTKLGITAEGCSTFTFPRLIGERKALEMLLFNHKMTAKEALEYGFINYLYKPEELQSKVWNKIVEVSKLPTLSISTTKKNLKGVLQDQLLKTNEKELEDLQNIWSDGQTQNAERRKSKL